MTSSLVEALPKQCARFTHNYPKLFPVSRPLPLEKKETSHSLILSLPLTMQQEVGKYLLRAKKGLPVASFRMA